MAQQAKAMKKSTKTMKSAKQPAAMKATKNSLVKRGKAINIKRKKTIQKKKTAPVKKAESWKVVAKRNAEIWPPSWRQVQRMLRKPTLEDVIRRLERTPARVGVSSVDGVGLIAIRPIKKGEQMYTGMCKQFYDEFGDKMIAMPESELIEMEKKPGLAGVAAMVRAYVSSYANNDNDGENTYGMVWRGLDSLCPIWFMNDGGANHNVRYLDGDEEDGIVAVRDIEAGEELLSLFEGLGGNNAHEVREYPDDAAWAAAKAKADEVRKDVMAAQKRLAEAESFVINAARAAASQTQM